MKYFYTLILILITVICLLCAVLGGIPKLPTILTVHQGQIQLVELPPTIIEKEVIKYIDRERIIYQSLSDWESEEELKEFLEFDQTDKAVFIDIATGQKSKGACEDYASMLRDHAEAIGRRLPLEKIIPIEYTALTGREWHSRQIDAHMMNHAITGNHFYYVEPQTDQIWKSTMLD